MRFVIPSLSLAIAILASCSPPPSAPTRRCSIDTSAGSTSYGQPLAAFDRGATAAALGCVNVQTCAGGFPAPRGQGHLKVTFGSDGIVVDAKVDREPYAGTDVAGCIEAQFRAVKIPPFAGGPLPVGKSFYIR